MKKVLCPGEALIDFVGTENKSLALSSTFLKKAGGAPANAAGAMSKLGVKPYFMGAVGNDSFGMFLKAQMDHYNINTDYLVLDDTAFTTMAFVSIDDDGERDFIFNRGADKNFTLLNTSLLEKIDGVHFASATAFLGGELEKSYDKLLQEAMAMNKLITFDANYREALFSDKKDYFVEKCKEYISKSNIVKLSEEEAALISGITDIESAGTEISSLGCDYLLITLGSKGTLVFSKGISRLVKSINVDCIDTTGAGDAFIGSVVAQAVDTKELTFNHMLDIVSLANKVGAITTENYGALESIPSIDIVKKRSKSE